MEERFTYDNLTDHLGNVRAEFVAHGGGQVELLQQTDYYPFGYTLRRDDYASTRPNHRLYGGKELQDETNPMNATDPSGEKIEPFGEEENKA